MSSAKVKVIESYDQDYIDDLIPSLGFNTR